MYLSFLENDPFKYSDLSITQSEFSTMTPAVRTTVENALKQARMNLDRRVESLAKEFRMQTQVPLEAARELQTVGNLLEEATRIIVAQYLRLIVLESLYNYCF